MEYFHKNFKELENLLNKKINGFPIPVLCTGSPGSGKSMCIKQISKKHNLDFAYLPCNGQTSKSDILGFIDAMGKNRESLFSKMYKNGGLFVFEEIDSVHQDTIITINSMIDSDEGSFGNNMYKRHKDFHIFATSNTYNGATDEFTARKQLDQSTLERFIKMDFKTDSNLEKNLLKDEYDLITHIREKLLDGKYFSMRQALMLVQMKDSGLIKALSRTAFRNHPELITSKYNDILKIAEEGNVSVKITSDSITNHFKTLIDSGIPASAIKVPTSTETTKEF